ncbi:MAG: hypothetical protein ABI723_04895 [Bacteroidia bacterium]
MLASKTAMSLLYDRFDNFLKVIKSVTVPNKSINTFIIATGLS